ncbi:RNA polymerase sigma factor [Micromonospora sp. NBC_01638]|uniref:RNA polymerase sigma factor n=1 Tax=Micromonospora sp. NBC_01638 TaxID=2975982 RepID=UPI00386DECFC|nr:hypothetical protein OG811_13780 [Micromonospora sp. NBC_01638]
MTHQVRPSDEELWGSIAAGDELAFGRLFDRYSRPVYNHAFRLTGGRGRRPRTSPRRRSSSRGVAVTTPGW